MLESHFDCGVKLVGLSNVESLNGLPSISFEKELPHLFIENVEVILVILVLVQILIDILALHAFDFARSK